MTTTATTITATLTSSTTDARPDIEVYLPKLDSDSNEGCHVDDFKGVGIIILPGGGYRKLAEHEGKGYAEFFQKQGYTCFVVNYRLGSEAFGSHRHPAMLEDALAAIETIRNSVSDYGITQLGIMGSSAGGHLAAHASVGYHANKLVDENVDAVARKVEGEPSVSLRPDFCILCYPVITMMGNFVHQGSCENLLGPTPTLELLEATSVEKHVSEDTPPCFIWHTVEDASVAVENSFLFAQALRKKQRPFELHIYEKGRHGLGLRAEFAWANDCLRWLKELKEGG